MIMWSASAQDAQNAPGATGCADLNPDPPNLMGSVANWRPASLA